MNPKPIIPHSRPQVDERGIAAVARALRAGHLSQGEEVARLEKDLSGLFDGAEVVAVASGTAALYLALVALGAQKGKKVILPSYTCRNLYAAVSFTGATPVCADTGNNSVCITPASVKPLLARPIRRMKKTIGAIIVPHMFGYRADIDGFMALGCPVIEDCAQALGGRHVDGAMLGNKGHIAVMSFYGTKLLPAGEGGACVTRRKNLAETIRLLRNCDERPLNPRAFNFKMADLNAALARANLQLLDALNNKRAEIARRYDAAFGEKSFRIKSAQPQAVCFRYLVELPNLNIGRARRLCLPAVLRPALQAGRAVWGRSAYPEGSPYRSEAEKVALKLSGTHTSGPNISHKARGKDRDIESFLKQALAAGIMCRKPVWEPLHLGLGGKCPRSERLHKTLISVPLYSGLSGAEIEKICAILPQILA